MKVRFERVEKSRPVLRPQARQHDPAYLAQLADSLLDGQLQPIGLLAADDAVVFGTGRVLAARMKPQITHLWAAIFGEQVSERDFLRMRFTENQLRQALSNAEKCVNCVEYARSDPGKTHKQIAQELHVDPSLVTRWMGWEKVIEPVRQALAANTITLQVMYALSQAPQEQQAEQLAAALAAPNAAAAATALRRKRNGPSSGNGEAARVSRCRLPLPSGVEVTVVGRELSLSDLIDSLTEIVREAKRAADQGLDIRTLAAVAKDKARKGRGDSLCFQSIVAVAGGGVLPGLVFGAPADWDGSRGCLPREGQEHRHEA